MTSLRAFDRLGLQGKYQTTSPHPGCHEDGVAPSSLEVFGLDALREGKSRVSSTGVWRRDAWRGSKAKSHRPRGAKPRPWSGVPPPTCPLHHAMLIFSKKENMPLIRKNPCSDYSI